VKKKRSVGLVILTKIEDLGWVAMLQRRGEFDLEKMKPQSFPGAYQVTVHGGCKLEEDDIQALTREIKEELGEEFYKTLDLNKVVEISIKETFDKVISTFGIVIPQEFLKRIPSAVGLKPVNEREADNIIPLHEADKKLGITDNRVTAMFKDEITAVKVVFRLAAS
jgi:8-oxo-dGTP pyrophosphatase MutT (NUDIX family)